MEKLLSLLEAASLAGVADKTFWAMMRSGKGPATVMIGKRRKIRESDWQTWLDSLEASAPAQPKASAAA